MGQLEKGLCGAGQGERKRSTRAFSAEQCDVTRGERSEGEQRNVRRLGKLLEAQDGHLDRRRGPLVVRHELAPDATWSVRCAVPYSLRWCRRCVHEQDHGGPDHDRPPPPSQWHATYASNSSSSKIRCGSRSTKTSKLLSSSVFAVVGVSADRCSNGFFSHRNQMGWRGWVSVEVPADEGRAVILVCVGCW